MTVVTIISVWLAYEFLKYDIEIRQIDISPFSDVGEMTKEQFLEKKKDGIFINYNNYLINRISEI